MVRLGDVAELIRGVSYKPHQLLAVGANAVPLLRATNIGNRVLTLTDVLYVPPTLVRDNQLLRRFDVVVAMSSGSRAAVGRLAQLRQDWVGCVGAFCGVVRPNPEKIVPEYLGYVLQSPQFRTRVDSCAEGTAIMNLSRERLLGFPLRLPPVNEQRRIASILGALDDKIELNRRMSRTLDVLLRVLFRDWCVNPVRQCWPSGNGDLPDGWSRTHLGDHVDIVRGLSYSSAQLITEEEGLALHNLNSVLEGGGHKFSGLKWFSGAYKDRNVVVPGELVVANVEQGFDFLLIGYGALIPAAAGRLGLFSADLYRVRPKASSSLTPAFLYMLLRDPQFHRIVAGYSNGTTVNHLPAEALSLPTVLLPPAHALAAFNDVAVSTLRRLEELAVECSTLAQIRGSLLDEMLGRS